MTAAAYRVALENSHLGTWAVLPVALSLLLMAASAGVHRAARGLAR